MNQVTPGERTLPVGKSTAWQDQAGIVQRKSRLREQISTLSQRFYPVLVPKTIQGRLSGITSRFERALFSQILPAKSVVVR